ncbi:MAG: hypothetical protein R3F43_15160 [bacterium]
MLAAFTRPPTSTAVAAHGARSAPTPASWRSSMPGRRGLLADDAGTQAAQAAGGGAAPVAVTSAGLPPALAASRCPPPGVSSRGWPRAPTTSGRRGFGGRFRAPSAARVLPGRRPGAWLVGVLIADARAAAPSAAPPPSWGSRVRPIWGRCPASCARSSRRPSTRWMTPAGARPRYDARQRVRARSRRGASSRRWRRLRAAGARHAAAHAPAAPERPGPGPPGLGSPEHFLVPARQAGRIC